MPKIVLTGDEARAKLKAGIDAITNAVSVTLGAKGRTVVIANLYQPDIVTKDGVTVCRNFEIEDTVENVGSAMIRDASLKTLDLVGDGTTTVCVLAQAMFSEGSKLVAAGINPMELKKGIDSAVKDIVDKLEKLSIPVGDKLVQVATVSANGDKEIGELVSGVYDKIGKDGLIKIEESGTPDTEMKRVEGMEIKQGFLSPAYINNPAKWNCEMKDALIFIYDRPITLWEELLPVLKAANQKNLLIICSELEGEAFATLNVNRVRGNLPVCAIRTPSFGERRKEILKDIAIMTGATVVSEQDGLVISKFKPEYFGKCESLIVDKDNTMFVGGGGDKKALKNRVDELRSFAAESGVKDFDKQMLEERAAKLSGGVAVLYVGGTSVIEMKEKRDRCDDAVRATKAALEEGVVPGGGIALLRLMPKEPAGTTAFEMGRAIVAKAVEAPLRQMCTNAGLDASYIVSKCANGSGAFGYNLNTGNFGDLLTDGIIDPAKVCRVTLQQAASIVGTILTSQVLMVEMPEKTK
jgi:chaperonin GroEL